MHEDYSRDHTLPEMLNPAKRQMNLTIIAWGVLSTLATFLLVEWIRSYGGDPMLVYIHHVIPAGAMVVGFFAGLGYAIGSKRSETRLGPWTLMLMACLHLVAWVMLYAAAWWHASAPGGDAPGISFSTWFDQVTQAIIPEHNSTGDPLHGWCYFIRIGEIIGFILGGMIAPLILYAVPYCENCQRYLKSKTLLGVPAATEYRAFASHDRVEAANAPIRKRMEQVAEQLSAAIASGDVNQVALVVESIALLTTPNAQVRDWLKIQSIRCPGCGNGFIDLNRFSDQAGESKRLHRCTVKPGMLIAVEHLAEQLPAMRQAQIQAMREAQT